MSDAPGFEESPVDQFTEADESMDAQTSEDSGALGQDAGMADVGGPSLDGRVMPLDADMPLDATRDAAVMDMQPSPRINELVFGASHRSYDDDHELGLVQQLTLGIRAFHFELHTSGFYGVDDDWQLGTGSPRNSVGDGINGNPETEDLMAWLRQLSNWSLANVNHAPITIFLQTDDDLSEADEPYDGNLGLLNQRLSALFGLRLSIPEQWPAGDWPTLRSLRGKVICVLTGSTADRTQYLLETGVSPSIAVGAQDRVIELHGTSDGGLVYYTGVTLANLRIDWRHRGEFGSGYVPAVAQNASGRVLVLAQDRQDEGRMELHVGRFRDDWTIDWRRIHYFGEGSNPTIIIRDEVNVEARYEYEQTRYIRLGVFEPDTDTVTWQMPMVDNSVPIEKNVSGGYRVDVKDDFEARRRTIQYKHADGRWERLRYRQLMFTDALAEDDSVLDAAARFTSRQADDSTSAFVGAAQSRGVQATRVWDFGQVQSMLQVSPTYPATMELNSLWYSRFLTEEQAVDWP